jgi:UDP-GlcNAc:undecaprenyl-phosphate/decaprenyl-phosphate GlcNAc-1-phosphate transferase
MIYLSTLLLSLFITISLVPPLKSLAVRYQAVDFPNERKVHSRPIPKIGGLAMACGALIPVLLWASMDRFGYSLLAGSAIIVLFGFIDDLMDLPYKAKFLAQVAAALVVIHFGDLQLRCLGNLAPETFLCPSPLAIPLTVFVVVGVTNAINLSDGLDGLAGGITLMTFICIGYLAYLGEHFFTLTVSVAVIGAIFGFLRFNTYPAVIFMGDTGSQLLGFLAICLSINITQGNQPLSPLLPLILLGFPILDTLTVMIERIRKGHSPFKPDKNHFHHKLMQLGFFQTEAVFTIYVLQSILITSAIVFRFYSEWFWLIYYVLFSGVIITTFVVLDRRQWKLPRTDVVDKLIKGRLKVLRERNIIIKVSFRSVEYGLPMLLAATCLLSRNIPGYFATVAGILSALMLAAFFIPRLRSTSTMRIGLYLIIPFQVYLSEAGAADLSLYIHRLYHLAFGVMVMFVVLTLKFTRRRKGFKTSPMDFLVLFIALVVPSITGTLIQNLNMGMIAAKIIVLLFGYEVLIGELRGELKRQVVFAAIALAIFPIKYLMG